MLYFARRARYGISKAYDCRVCLSLSWRKETRPVLFLRRPGPLCWFRRKGN